MFRGIEYPQPHSLLILPILSITGPNRPTITRRNWARLTTPALPTVAVNRTRAPFRRSRLVRSRATSIPLRYTPSKRGHQRIPKRSRSNTRLIVTCLCPNISRNRPVRLPLKLRAPIPGTLHILCSLRGHQAPGISLTMRLRPTNSRHTRPRQEATQMIFIGSEPTVFLFFESMHSYRGVMAMLWRG